jgi:Protein of unknown function (DUF2721)
MFGIADSRQRRSRDPDRIDTRISAFGHCFAIERFFNPARRVSDRVDALSEKLEDAEPTERARLQERLTYLRRRSQVLDAAVMLGTLGGAATCLAALFLFVGTLREETGVGVLFVSFGLALLFTVGALAAFLIEMLLASRGIRDRVAKADEEGDAAAETPDEGGTHDSADPSVEAP